MTLTALIEALEKATGPDRNMDRWICWFGKMEPWANTPDDQLENLIKWTMTGSKQDKETPAFTASVDAAIALAANVLPGWCFDHIGQDYLSDRNGHGLKGMGWAVEIVDGMTRRQGQAQTFPIAILLAILSALQAKEGRRSHDI